MSCLRGWTMSAQIDSTRTRTLPLMLPGTLTLLRLIRSARNLKPAANGLQLASTSSGEAVFEVFTPWIIVPKVNTLDNPTDDTEASVVTLHAARPVTVAVSADQGNTWQPVTTVEVGKASVDLTQRVKGTHGYLLRLLFAGDAEDLVLRNIKIETWV
jgi:hypothetical protein